MFANFIPDSATLFKLYLNAQKRNSHGATNTRTLTRHIERTRRRRRSKTCFSDTRSFRHQSLANSVKRNLIRMENSIRRYLDSRPAISLNRRFYGQHIIFRGAISRILRMNQGLSGRRERGDRCGRYGSYPGRERESASERREG